MENIKFRAWHKKKKKMLDVYEMAGDTSIRDVIDLIDWNDDGVAPIHYNDVFIKDIILIQFTGLFDKIGKEIWEGDIVEVSYPDDWCYEKGDKERHQNAGKIVCISEVKFSARSGYYVDLSDCWYDWKVIGNVYENNIKDLLLPIFTIKK